MLGGLTGRGRANYYCDKAISKKTMGPWDNYFTALEAGRSLKIHPETVKRLCRQGDIPAVKIHNTWLINKDVLDNFAGTYVPRRGPHRKLL